MPLNDLGVRQRAAMLALMAEAREVTNRELEEITGFRLDGKHRVVLNQQDLVASRKVGRMLAHELTEKGWAWCADELSRTRPPRVGSPGGALYALLAGLRRYLDRTGLTLADVFGPGTGPADESVPAAESVPGPPVATAAPVARVQAAYRQLAGQPRAWVSLTALRQRVADLSRQQVDDALRSLTRGRLANLVPQSRQQDLTVADRQAAVRIGGEDCHLVSMEDAR